MSWPAALFASVVAVLAAALIYRILEWRVEWRQNAVLAAYRAESIEANKELEVLRHKCADLGAELERASGELARWQSLYANRN